MGTLNLVTGTNGTGKSNVYRALRLLSETAQGGIIASLAREGGLASTLWAGPESISTGMRNGSVAVQGSRRSKPVSLGLGFVGNEFSYSIDLGLPARSNDGSSQPLSAFSLDPEIKGEYVWSGSKPQPAAMLVERRGSAVKFRGSDGAWNVSSRPIPRFDSMLTHFADPRITPELLVLRDAIRSWRFYDHFRTDATAPARLPQVGTHTPILGHDGADLAAALQTIKEIGDPEMLNRAVEDAFPGSTVEVSVVDGWFETRMTQYGLLRSLRAVELSDGTLRYLLWIAALLSPRPPALLVLNEPETSLHPDLLPALGRLISMASANSQIIVVSHAPRLIASLEAEQCVRFELQKDIGETLVIGQGILDKPIWSWIPR